MDLKYFLLNGHILILLAHVIFGGDPTCPSNIKTCYNCAVVPGCAQNEYNNISEEDCLLELTNHVTIWSVEYVYSTGYCRQSNCGDIEIEYKAGSVIHRKTCDTSACADYTLTKTNYTTVSALETTFFSDNGPKMRECLAHCLLSSSGCTISYESVDKVCNVYTDCQNNCSMEPATETFSVYKKYCGNQLTGTMSTAMTTPTTPTTTKAITSPTPSSSPSSPSSSPSSPSSPSSSSSSPSSSSSSSTSPTTASSVTTPTSKTTSTASLTTTSIRAPLPKLFIAPCICYFNKTFVNMTKEEIITLLVNDIKIDEKSTSLQQSKSKCASDLRTSSKVMGSVAIIVLCSLGSFVLCLDLLTLGKRLRPKIKGKRSKPSRKKKT
ncbi:uncharacterized protein LOC132725859 [Ruditapes philippinarum]|uniref:uncharacterized protein LOC132725859 n=1 Tax=Ruditapes philippinarum TaxID=129788 RepID=UPI00295BC983|nr:uncharacterized protein LOC132725859 [Ruditapes philippinarum]